MRTTPGHVSRQNDFYNAFRRTNHSRQTPPEMRKSWNPPARTQPAPLTDEELINLMDKTKEVSRVAHPKRYGGFLLMSKRCLTLVTFEDTNLVRLLYNMSITLPGVIKEHLKNK